MLELILVSFYNDMTPYFLNKNMREKSSCNFFFYIYILKTGFYVSIEEPYKDTRMNSNIFQ
jgi:hypothetical protein